MAEKRLGIIIAILLFLFAVVIIFVAVIHLPYFHSAEESNSRFSASKSQPFLHSVNGPLPLITGSLTNQSTWTTAENDQENSKNQPFAKNNEAGTQPEKDLKDSADRSFEEDKASSTALIPVSAETGELADTHYPEMRELRGFEPSSCVPNLKKLEYYNSTKAACWDLCKLLGPDRCWIMIYAENPSSCAPLEKRLCWYERTNQTILYLSNKNYITRKNEFYKNDFAQAYHNLDYNPSVVIHRPRTEEECRKFCDILRGCNVFLYNRNPETGFFIYPGQYALLSVYPPRATAYVGNNSLNWMTYRLPEVPPPEKTSNYRKPAPVKRP